MKAKYTCLDRGFLKTILLYTLNFYGLQGSGSGFVMGSRSRSRFWTEVAVRFQDYGWDWGLGQDSGRGSMFVSRLRSGSGLDFRMRGRV